MGNDRERADRLAQEASELERKLIEKGGYRVGEGIDEWLERIGTQRTDAEQACAAMRTLLAGFRGYFADKGFDTDTAAIDAALKPDAGKSYVPKRALDEAVADRDRRIAKLERVERAAQALVDGAQRANFDSAFAYKLDRDLRDALARVEQQAPANWDATVADYIAWARATFPGERTLPAARHLCREAAEVLRAVESVDAPDTIAEECADTIMMALNVADRVGADSLAAFRAKLDKNKTRTWAAPDADGIVEHEREQQAPALVPRAELDASVAQVAVLVDALTELAGWTMTRSSQPPRALQDKVAATAENAPERARRIMKVVEAARAFDAAAEMARRTVGTPAAGIARDVASNNQRALSYAVAALDAPAPEQAKEP